MSVSIKNIIEHFIKDVHDKNCNCHMEPVPFYDTVEIIDEKCTKLRERIKEYFNENKDN